MKSTSSTRAMRAIDVGDRFDRLVVVEKRAATVVLDCACGARVFQNPTSLLKKNGPERMCKRCRAEERGQRDFRIHFVGQRFSRS